MIALSGRQGLYRQGTHVSTLRAAAAIAGIITVIAILMPLGAGGTDGDSAGLGAAIIGWLFVAPLSGLATILLAATASVLTASKPETNRGERRASLVLWGAALIVAVILVAVSYGSDYSDSILTGLALGLATLLLLAFIAVAIAAAAGANAANTAAEAAEAADGALRRSRRRVWVLAAVASVAALALSGVVASKASLSAEYNSVSEQAVDTETSIADQENEYSASLAIACLSHPSALARLERIDGVASATPPVLPQEHLDELRRLTERARASLEAFDPADCETAAADLAAEVERAGNDLDGLDWGQVLFPSDLAGLRPEREVPSAETLSLWEVTGADVREAHERLGRAEQVSRSMNDMSWEVRDAPRASTQILGVVTGLMRSAVPDAAEAVISASGTEGTPEAAELRALAASVVTDESVTYGVLSERFIDYLVSASAMLERAGITAG